MTEPGAPSGQTDELRRMHAELGVLWAQRVAALEMSDGRFRSAFHNVASVAVQSCAPDGQVQYWNHAAERLYGYTAQEAVGRNVLDLIVPPDMREDVRRAIAHMAQTGESIPASELSLMRKDGSRVAVFSSHALVQMPGCAPELFRLDVDISDRKRAEEALRESERWFRNLFEQSNDAIFIHDDRGHILDVNPRAVEMLGYSRDEMLALATTGFPAPEVLDDALAAFSELIKTGHVRVGSTFRKKDGSPIDVDISVRQVESGSAVFQAVVRDISDRTRGEAEHAALQAQTLQLQKSESLGRMAGAMAHQFNNLLGAVLGNLELAVADLPHDAGPAECLIDAMSAARRAVDVCGLMLTYLGESSGTRMRVDLAEVCRRQLPVLRAAIPQAVVLETHVSRLGPAIMANLHEIEQLLTHVVTNAREAIGNGLGLVRLTVSTVAPADVHAAHVYPQDWKPRHPAYACLAVADTGCGIAAADIQHLFDPFYTTKFVGRGLGLPVVLGIARAHGGAITVESEPGRGSCFRVFFPVCADNVPGRQDPAAIGSEATAPAPDTVSAPAPVTAIGGGGTVLLVEDEKLVRKMAAMMLSRLGFAVLEARDGVEAVDVFRQHMDDIRVVLCDLTMPRMNGWETMAALRALAPAIPVVLASGYDEACVMNGNHPAWPGAFLSKPYGLQALGTAIELAVRKGVGPRSTSE